MAYVPKKGDIVIVDFDPQTGHEQKGRRPALVISNDDYHTKTKFLIACPITNTRSGFPTHVLLDDKTHTTGEIMCEQVRSLDISARNTVYKEKAPDNIVNEVIDIVYSFFP